jgi:hypothetical protein
MKEHKTAELPTKSREKRTSTDCSNTKNAQFPAEF